MKITRKCAYCGKEFTTTNGTKKYCSYSCLMEANKKKKKKEYNFLNSVEAISEISHQEYLTFSKAAILMGCSRQYVYKLVEQGKLKASRLSNRMSLIKRVDIDKMLEDNPYNRVLLGSRPNKESTIKVSDVKTSKPKAVATENIEPPTYISGEDVIKDYKVKQSWLYKTAKEHQIPFCKIAGKNYYSKQHIEECLGVSVDIKKISNWLTVKEAQEKFGLSHRAFITYVYRYNIPRKKEYGINYYSQSHLEQLLRPDLVMDDNYCTVAQIAQEYGLNIPNVNYIVKKYNVTRIKVGPRNFCLRKDVERVMAERAKKGL